MFIITTAGQATHQSIDNLDLLYKYNDNLDLLYQEIYEVLRKVYQEVKANTL